MPASTVNCAGSSILSKTINQFTLTPLVTINGWEKAASMSIVIGITVLEAVDPTTYIMSPSQEPTDRIPSG